MQTSDKYNSDQENDNGSESEDGYFDRKRVILSKSEMESGSPTLKFPNQKEKHLAQKRLDQKNQNELDFDNGIPMKKSLVIEYQEEHAVKGELADLDDELINDGQGIQGRKPSYEPGSTKL